MNTKTAEQGNQTTLTQILETLNRQEVILSQIVFALSREDVLALKKDTEKKEAKRQLAGIIENYCKSVGKKKSA